VRIRDANMAEAAALAELQRRSSSVWEEDRLALERHPDAIFAPTEAIRQGHVRVAVDDEGSLLGFCAAFAHADGAWELDDLFVEPEHMRSGVGRALVEDAAARARAAGARRVAVTANPRAYGFYERVGFVFGETVQTRFYPARRMHLDLTKGAQ
jgi:GNAT superfamily N-acetyltransferase